MRTDFPFNLATSLGYDHSVLGQTVIMTAGENLAFGDVCYLKSDGKLWKTDADAIATMPGRFMAAATITANNTGLFLRKGYARDDTWNWTIGGLLYVDTVTAGGMTQTPPSGSLDQVQVVGLALTADIAEFDPSHIVADPANQDFSNLPLLVDPHVAGKAFLDENGKVTVSAG